MLDTSTNHEFSSAPFFLMNEDEFLALQRLLLQPFEDDRVDEILVNGSRGMTIVRGQSTESRSSPFYDLEAQTLWLQEFAMRRQVRLDALCGQAGGHFALEGSPQSFRWHCLLPPLAQDGALLSLRRHRFETLSLSSFRAKGEDLNALQKHFCLRRPLLIAGPTGSGKTSLLASLLKEEAYHERVFAIETLPELPLASPHWVRLVERRANLEGIGAVSLEKLIHESMRLRPDRLVIGEIRGEEARAFFEALTTGHGGVAATIHAGSAAEAVYRLLQLARLHEKRADDASAGLLQNFELGIALLERGSPPLLSHFSIC